MTATLTHEGKEYPLDIDGRLSGTDYVKVAVSKINGEWLEKQPRLGDEIVLHVVATVVETGRRLTDDGIQATAKLEVSGVTVVDE